MSFSPIDKMPGFSPTVSSVDGEAASVAGGGNTLNSVSSIDQVNGFDHGAIDHSRTGARDLSQTSAPLDPHSVLALDAWPAAGPRLFKPLSASGTSADERVKGGPDNRTSAPDDPDELAANVVSFLI